MSILGTGLALLMLALIAAALVAVWRVPFRALGVLVAGMAFHNFAIMLLLALDTPEVVIRAVQAWKEAILLLLLALAARLAWTAFRSRKIPRLLLLDWVVAAFALLALIYFMLPPGVMPTEGNLAQRLVSIRTVLLLPGLYAFGRIFWSARREDHAWVAGAVLGAAGVVGLFGLVELWFVPTPTWLNWGATRFSDWIGYTYARPEGLPENFFQSTAAGYLVRRMVSTYISPLGLAYTGLLLVPLGVALIARTGNLRAGLRERAQGLPPWLLWTTFVLLIVGILFSITRGALLSLVGELVLLCLLIRRWRIVATSVAVTLGVVFILFEYVNIGPLLTFDLREVRPPAGLAATRLAMGLPPNDPNGYPIPGRPGTLPGEGEDVTTSGELISRTLSMQDTSASGHVAALRHGMDYASQHPFGTGLGSAVPRYGTTSGPGESALLVVIGEMGIAGGLLYLAMYLLSIAYGLRAYWRVRGDLTLAALPLVAAVGGLALLPIMITSNIWGNFSVTFLFWWCAGFSGTLLALSTEQLGRAIHPQAATPSDQAQSSTNAV
ncbi:MAG TPA: O-antigen ligase family protein [Chloroflexia bacterium]|nr:O-antigen ligase family protein [Chloroflexia bacterium]